MKNLLKKNYMIDAESLNEEIKFYDEDRTAEEIITDMFESWVENEEIKDFKIMHEEDNEFVVKITHETEEEFEDVYIIKEFSKQKEKVEEILNMYYDEMYTELFGQEYSEERESLLYAVLSAMSIDEIEDFSSWLSEYFLVESYDDVYFLQKYLSYRREEEKEV